MSQWFATKRGITRHPLFVGRPERLAIWIWLLDNTCWQDTPHDINGKTVLVKRGQVCVSLRRMANEIGVGVKAIRLFLERFREESMVGTSTAHGRTIITICNWDKYQLPQNWRGTGEGTAGAQQGHTKDTKIQITPLSPPNDSDASSDEPPKEQKKIASRISPDWTPCEDGTAYAKKRGMTDAEIKDEAERFVNYWLAKPGKEGTKLDWPATWRNWVIKSRSISQQTRRPQHAAAASPWA